MDQSLHVVKGISTCYTLGFHGHAHVATDSGPDSKILEMMITMRLSIARSSWRERSFYNNKWWLQGGAEVGREKGSCRDWDKRVELQ